ncbi:MAG: diacylglycerol kinase family protein [Verrucomicrobiales bacterium]|nr:diacylglycerol kinase family protein [Verrucomicrobiales bacterium]
MNSQTIDAPQKVSVIVNPASGGPYPILFELNKALISHDWAVEITRQAGDGEKFARAAVGRGSELVIVYGGDGTLLEAINGLVGSTVPMLVLRGGTGNLIADELGLPSSIKSTLELLCGSHLEVRTMDLGLISGETHFLLRCGCGLEVEALKLTDTGEKSGWGKLAYVKGFLRALAAHKEMECEIWIDDEQKPLTASAVALTVANAGRVGLGELQIAPDVSVSDGLLDICLIEKAEVQSAIEFLSMNSGLEDEPPRLSSTSLVRHQTAKKVRIVTDPPVRFQTDGDLSGMTPLDISVVPQAVRVITGKSKGD